MKKILFLGIFGLISLSVLAQISFSCTYREYCDWNEYSEAFTNCSGYNESSLFVMNENETLFKHVTKTISSTYYVQSREYDKKNDVYTYFVTSDVGNKYYYVFDLKNKEIRALLTDDKGKMQLVRFYIKAIF